MAVLTLLTLELIRSSGPLLDQAYASGGVTTASVAAVVTYLAPGLVLVAVRLTGRAALSWLVRLCVVLAGLRLVVQGVAGPARFTLGLLTVAVGIATLTLAVAILAGRPGGGSAAGAALSLGAAGGVGLHLALGTWDAYWRPGVLGWSVALAVVGCLAGLTIVVHQDRVRWASPQRSGRLWALGPWLALAAMMLANPAFAAAQSGTSLTVAGPVLAFGLLAAARVGLGPAGRADLSRPLARRFPGWVAPTALVALVAAGMGLGEAVAESPVLVLLALVGAQLAAGVALSRALSPVTGSRRGAADKRGSTSRSWWLSVTAALVGLSTIVPLLVYQIDYVVPLGPPNEVVFVLTAALLGAAGVGRAGAVSRAADSVDAGGFTRTDHAAPDDSDGRRHRSRVDVLVVACLVLATVGTGAGVAVGATSGVVGAERARKMSGRVMSWNLHYGVSTSGSVDLERIARTIESQNPDVVLLQEVSRGWVLGGGVDMATWLSNRLGLPFVFAPAADRRFGNVIMSRLPPREVAIRPLPYGAGPQRRSAVMARVRVGEMDLDVVCVHLQHLPANTPTRLRQLRAVLSDPRIADAHGVPVILAGDLNAGPGAPEIALLADAGFVSGTDRREVARGVPRPQRPSGQRFDWILGRGVSLADADVLGRSGASDHAPVVTTVRP